MGKKVQSYTAEFRAEAVKLVLAQGPHCWRLRNGFRCPRVRWRDGLPTLVAERLWVFRERVLLRIWKQRINSSEKNWRKSVWSGIS